MCEQLSQSRYVYPAYGCHNPIKYVMLGYVMCKYSNKRPVNNASLLKGLLVF